MVARASWGLWEADVFPKSVTHSLKTSWGDSGACILRHETLTGPHSGRNRMEEGGVSRRLRGWWRSAGGSERPIFSPKGALQSQDIVWRLWGVYAAWIELNLALQWQQPGGRRRHEQAAPGVTLWWPGPAGGSGRPMFSPKA